MNKKIIDTSLQPMLENKEIETVKMLYDILHEIYVRYGDITDSDIKKYNSDENGQYHISISISTIRNYLKIYHYTIKKDDNCIVREMTVAEYASTVPTINNNSENKGGDFMDNLTVKQKISLAYADKSDQYNNLKLMSLRCSTDVLDRFNSMAKNYKCFDKSYLLSYVLEAGMDVIGYNSEEK
jgi:hypothetical protein